MGKVRFSVSISLDGYIAGGGVRLLGDLGPDSIQRERLRVVESTGVPHLRHRVVH
jgi:hypothetical protein